MRIECKTLRVSVCLFALLCLSSVGYASPPSADVHLCRVLDFEDMWARDSLYAATKQALDLNVGEPRTVRMIYFLPNDRPFRQEVVDSMKVTIRQIQTFYAEQMQAHGYGNKTFRFETDDQGEPVVHRVDGQHPDSHYLDNTFFTVLDEIEQTFDHNANIYLTVVDYSIDVIGPGSSVEGKAILGGGFVLVPAEFHWTTAAHELGHALGMYHDFKDGTYIMSYGSGRNRLSMCHAEFLSVHPYFNPDTPTEEAQSPSIELISPIGYPPGSKSVSIQLKISDSEGLHQVILFVKTTGLHPAAGFLEVKACRGLAGEKDAVVEFEHDGFIPSDSRGSLSYSTEHPISVAVVDTDGNISRISFELWEVPPQYIATLEGHMGWVRSLSFSPDGTILASGSIDTTVVLWDVATRSNIATLEGHIGEIMSVAFSPDGTILASSASNMVTLWDVATRSNIATLEDRSWVQSVSFSPDGAMLASGLSDATVVLWDVATRTNIATLEGHTSWVQSVSFSPDGKTLVSSSDATVVLWDVATRTNIATLKEHGEFFHSVSFSPDGAMLASAMGGGRRAIKLWDVATRHNIATLEIGDDSAYSIVFSPEGLILASGGNASITLWDVSEWGRPRPVTFEKVSGDNQQGIPSEALMNPYVVEVRDQYGAPLQGAQVAFTVTSGDGKLSGRFTVGNATTDANGQAEITLVLGPNPGTNTVEASVAGIEVTFKAVGVGTPATLVVGGDYQMWHLPDGAMTRLGKGRVSERDNAIAFSPGGQRLAVASDIGVWLYDVATSREVALLTGHTDGVSSVAYSPDGTILASGSRDKTVKLWDVATGENITTLEGHTRNVNYVAFSSSGKTLATWSFDGIARLWDVSTRENIAILNIGGSRAVYSPDGTTFATVANYGSYSTVELWDVSTGENIATLERHGRGFNSIAFSSDGKTLASAAEDRTIKLWDVSTGENIAILKGHTLDIGSIAFSSDGKTLASGSWDKTIKLWDISTGENIATLEGHKSWLRSIAFSPNGTMLASASWDGTINLWDIETQNFVALRHTRRIESVAFSPEGTTLAAGVNLWDVATGRNVATLERSVGPVGPVTFSPDGRTLVSGTDWKVRLWDVETGENTAVLEGHSSIVNSVAYSPDGKTLASGAWDNTVKLWDMKRKEMIATLEGHKDGVLSIAKSPDGTTLASAGGYLDKTVKLWDIKTPKNIATLEGHTDAVTSVVYSPDGTMLASGSEDYTIRLWDVETGETISILEGHTQAVTSVAYSPDGTILASGVRDKTIRLWDIETEQNIATFEGHRDRVRSVAFLPYGTTLASGSDDGTALMWDVSAYIIPVVNIPDANLSAVIRDALDKSRFAPITTTDMASLTTLDASNRNIRDLTGLESATNLTELNLTDNRLSSLSINTHIPALQDRGVEVLFDKTPTPDFDGDGVVGFADFLLFVAQFGFGEDDEGYDVWFDLDGDGMIGFGDFLIFANAFGKAASSN